MEQTRVFKYEDEEGNSCFIVSDDESLARKELEKLTLRQFKLVGTKFLDDLPGYGFDIDLIFDGPFIIKNNIDPF